MGRLPVLRVMVFGALAISGAAGGCGSDDELEAPIPGQRRIVSLSRAGSRSCGSEPKPSFSFTEGAIYAALRDALLDPRNFGPSGVVPVTLVFRPSIGLIRPRSVGKADILVINNPAVPIDEAAAATMESFVERGGSILTLGEDVPVSLGDKGECAPDPDAAVTTSVPAITAGPFGAVTGTVATGYNCSFTGLAPGVETLAANEKGPNALVLDAAAARPGAGRVVAFGDDEAFAGITSANCGSGYLSPGNANERLALNTFAFLALARPATE